MITPAQSAELDRCWAQWLFMRGYDGDRRYALNELRIAVLTAMEAEGVQVTWGGEMMGDFA